jgi:hypothetical protein
MSRDLRRSIAPALTGHAFQQTALISMLPVVSERLALSPAAIGGAVSVGMIAAAASLPVMGAFAGRRLTIAALLALLASSVALMAMLEAGPALWQGALLALPALVLVRVVQGVAAGGILVVAQRASVGEDNPRAGLARTHSAGAIGRSLGALLIGPLLWISVMVPLVPAALGAVVAMLRLPTARSWPAGGCSARPWWRAMAAPTLIHSAIGAAQIGLAPLIVQRLALPAMESSAIAGFCLAAANGGLLAAHRWITPVATARTARLAAGAMIAAALLIPFSPGVPVLLLLSAVIGGASALLLTLNLSYAIAARPSAGGSVAGWNGAAQIGGLALGVAVGSAVLPLSVAAPFLVAAALSAPLALSPVVRLWSAP